MGIAKDLGVFGSPTCTVGCELFGTDAINWHG
jgi:hypothetical protein